MTPMSDLLRAIKAAPADDGLRLILADWLEDNNQPGRGEFVRLQIEKEALPENDPRRAEAGEREQELLDAHQAEWLGPFHDCKWRFRRGLLELEVEEGADFLQRIGSPAGRRSSDWIDALTVRQGDEAERVVEAMSAAGLYLNSLALRCSVGRVWNRPSGIWRSPMLAQLRSLELCAMGVDDDDARALAASPYLGNLNLLNLRCNDVCVEGVGSLAGSPVLSGLTHLYLSNWNIVGDEGARMLASSPHLTAPMFLGLSGTEIGDEGARALAASAGMRWLLCLDLSCNGIGDEGALALAASPHLQNCRYLDLQSNDVSGKGAEALRSRFADGVIL